MTACRTVTSRPTEHDVLCQNASSLAIEQGRFLSPDCYAMRSSPCVTELAAHPDVLEASVVARPHPHWGERAMAFVILRTQAADKWRGKHGDFEVELKKHARSRLPGFACPEWVQIVDELPVRALGLEMSTVRFNCRLLSRKRRRARSRKSC